MLSRHTDLACEAREIWNKDNLRELQGASEKQKVIDGFLASTIKITDEHAARELNKPCGTYITIGLGKFLRREDESFRDGAEAIASLLREVLPREGDVLVAGLGNPSITPDAIGHIVLRNTLVTRHLKEQSPEHFAAFRGVSALEPGVLGTTGIESAEIIKAVVRDTSPAVVIAVDALASRSMDRVCKTVQIADTGIVPGSGVGNARAALNEETLGVPVIAVGVPTVVDAATLALDLAEESGSFLDPEALRRHQGAMIVTPREIDSRVAEISKLVGYAIDLALHDGLTVDDVEMLVG